MYGTVTDPTGAAIPSAPVTLTNELTGAITPTRSNPAGEFTFTFLPVGTYTISIEAQGFKSQRRTGLELVAGQSVRLTFALELGAVNESVTISAEAQLLDTANSEQEQSLNTTQVRELPLAKRDWTGLLNLGTGMVTGGATSGGVALNGLPTAGFTLTVDGTDASGDSEYPSLSLYQNWNLIKAVSMEAVSEVNVTKGIASAEIANSLSGNVNIITRSGSNEFHGSLFENNQTQHGSARNQFLTLKPPLTFNQFGGSIGGPIKRNKLFFFGVYEGYRLRSFQAISGNVPTTEFRNQAITAVPAYKSFFNIIPLPNQPYAAGAVTGFYQGAGTFQGNDNHAVVRGDYQITSTDLLSARYTRSRPDQLTPRIEPTDPQTYKGTLEMGSLSYTHIRPGWSAESRFGVNLDVALRTDAIAAQALPSIIGNIGFGSEVGNAKVQDLDGSTKTGEEVIAITRGRHSLKVGGIYQYRIVDRYGPGNADYSYASVADFLTNTPASITFTFGTKPFSIRTWQLGGFVQDDFKVSRNLVLNIGFRYDYFSVPTEVNNLLFNHGAPFGFGPLRPFGSIYDAAYNNFAPRLGFAWTPDKSSKTVIRGGAGVFFSPHTMYGGPVSVIENGLTAPFRSVISRADAITYGIGYPDGLNSPKLGPLVTNPNAPWSGQSISTNFPNPRTYQWMLSVERQITSTLAWEGSYVGNHGADFIYLRDQNQVDRITGLRPVPGFLQFTYWDDSESSHYNSFQTSLRKRLSSALSFDIHYTFASNISYGDDDILQPNSKPQDNNNIRAERGPTQFDTRHRFNADAVYELPFARLTNAQSRPAKMLASGWQVTSIFAAYTGLPLYILQSSAESGSRPDYVGGNPIESNYRQTLQYLNPAAFAKVPVITISGATARPGTLGRNAIRQPGLWDTDLSLSKNIAVTERVRFQIRGDLFNAFNHTNFNAVSSGITSANFGRLTSTTGPRIVQFNARLTF
jgi:hypothetical protein